MSYSHIISNTSQTIITSESDEQKFNYTIKDTFTGEYLIKIDVLIALYNIELSYGAKIASAELCGQVIRYSLSIYSTSEKKADEIAIELTESIISTEIEQGCLKLLGWIVDYFKVFQLDNISLDPDNPQLQDTTTVCSNFQQNYENEEDK